MLMNYAPQMLGLVGKKRSGKDTFFNELFNQVWFFRLVQGPRQCPERFAFADKLKEELAEILGVPLEYLHANKEMFRAALQEHGSNRRGQNPAHWINELVLSDAWRDCRGWRVITDVRYRNEADFIRSQGGILIRIVRPELESNDLHESETEQDVILCDYRITNTTLGEYRIAISRIIPVLLGMTDTDHAELKQRIEYGS